MNNWIDIEIKPLTKNDGLKYECKICNLIAPNPTYFCLEGRQTPVVITNDIFFNRYVVVNPYIYGIVYCYKKYE